MLNPLNDVSPSKDPSHIRKKKAKVVEKYLFSDDEPLNDENSFEFDDDFDFGCEHSVNDAYKVPPPPSDSTGRFYRMKVETAIKSSYEVFNLSFLSSFILVLDVASLVPCVPFKEFYIEQFVCCQAAT